MPSLFLCARVNRSCTRAGAIHTKAPSAASPRLFSSFFWGAAHARPSIAAAAAWTRGDSSRATSGHGDGAPPRGRRQRGHGPQVKLFDRRQQCVRVCGSAADGQQVAPEGAHGLTRSHVLSQTQPRTRARQGHPSTRLSRRSRTSRRARTSRLCSSRKTYAHAATAAQPAAATLTTTSLRRDPAGTVGVPDCGGNPAHD